MKKILAITAIALFSLAMAGCNFGTDVSGETTYRVISKLQERIGADLTVTEYEYDEQAAPSGRQQTLNGRLVWEDTGYEYEDWKITCTRTLYDASGKVEGTQKRIDWYFAGWADGTYKGEVYGSDGGTTPIESWEDTYEVVNNYSLIFKGHEEKKNGQVVFSQYDFVYDNLNRLTDYTQQKGGVVTEMHRAYSTTSDGYELYADWNGTTGRLVEKMSNIESDSEFSYSYDHSVYDEDGVPTVTNIERTYREITVKY